MIGDENSVIQERSNTIDFSKIIEETFENYTDKEYKNANDYIDKLINKIYFKTKKDVINGENELKIYLSNENLKKIILD